MCHDANAYMRDQISAGMEFDAIVLDPPKFAPTAAHAERAARAYKVRIHAYLREAIFKLCSFVYSAGTLC